MKFIIMPPDECETPDDFRLYDTMDDALKALREMDGTIEEIQGYSVAAVVMEYKVLVNIQPSATITGKKFQIVDSDGDEICGHTSTNVDALISHFKGAHGTDVYLSDIESYAIYETSGEEDSVDLTYGLRTDGTKVYGIGEATKAMLPSPESPAKPKELRDIVSKFEKADGNRPNEIVLGGGE